MDLALEGTRARGTAAKAAEQEAEQGDDVRLLLQLPDGTQHAKRFKMGATVAYVKLEIERDHGLPMASQTLTAGASGRVLIDPLSLADCPGIAPGEAACLVVVSERA